jgi:hypothetical protein
MLSFKISGNKDKYIIFILCEKIVIQPVWVVENPKLLKGDLTSFKIIDKDIEIHFEECIIQDTFFGEK